MPPTVNVPYSMCGLQANDHYKSTRRFTCQSLHARVYSLVTEDVFLLSIPHYVPSGEIVDLLRSITNLDIILLLNALLEKIYLKLYKVIIISRDYKSYKFAQIVCHCQVVKFKTWSVDITLC